MDVSVYLIVKIFSLEKTVKAGKTCVRQVFHVTVSETRRVCQQNADIACGRQTYIR